MSIFKKITLFCLTLLLAIPMSVGAVSDSNNSKGQEETIVVNEYTKLKDLQKMDVKELKAKGHNEDEINSLKKMDIKKEYSEYIKKMAKYSEAELKKFNYTDTQINAIKNYDGSEQMTALAASSVTVYTSKSSYSYSSSTNKTDLTPNFVSNPN